MTSVVSSILLDRPNGAEDSTRLAVIAARGGLLLALLLTPAIVFADVQRQAQTPIIVMLSLDGYRFDYADKHPEQSQQLRRLADLGLRASGLVPSFPSSTFSIHYSIATGLYPGRHGIIGNGFYDRERDARYRLGDRSAVEDGSWYGGEPLWVAVEKAGMRAASFFWVGSEADVQGIRPSYYKKYDGGIANSQRVDQVLDWLALPVGERPNLVTLYFSTVDSAGHRFGPDSQQVKDAIASVDLQIGRLIDGLADIDHPVYLLVSSDHGMLQVNASQTVFLDDYVTLSRWRGRNRLVPGGAYVFFYSDDAELLKDTIAGLSGIEGLTLLQPPQFPEALNFPERGARIPDLVAVVSGPRYIGLRKGRGRPPPQGAHGYLSHDTPSMKGIFYAMGPRIAPRVRVSDIENIQIYPLVMSLLNIPLSTSIDGDVTVLGQYLQTPVE